MIEPIIFNMKVVENDAILMESETGRMYFINPNSIIIPHCHRSRQKEFEEKLQEFLKNFYSDKS